MAGKTALIIVDIQNDFCEGGSLAVPGASDVIKKVNDIRNQFKFDCIIATKDYHPANHVSFAKTHNKEPFTSITLENGSVQALWPVHCVQGSAGESFHKDLVITPTDKIIQKGIHVNIDSYSGFGENGEDTGLNQFLKDQNVSKVFVVGLAYDYCAGSTAVDSAKNGYKTYFVVDATGSISDVTVNKMRNRFQECGQNLELINIDQIKEHL